MSIDEHAPLFVISVAAELAGMHPQTLRTYDRLGIVSPSRASGRGRRYSARNIAQLRQVQQLSQEEGINLAGIKRILELESQVAQLHSQLAAARAHIAETEGRPVPTRRVFATSQEGEITALRQGQRPRRSTSASGALVVWRPNIR